MTRQRVTFQIRVQSLPRSIGLRRNSFLVRGSPIGRRYRSLGDCLSSLFRLASRARHRLEGVGSFSRGQLLFFLPRCQPLPVYQLLRIVADGFCLPLVPLSLS